MDWEAAIDRNRTALKRIVAALFAMAGLDDRFVVVESLPRYAYRAILLVLRPAESAMRRLIVIAERGVTVTLRPSPSKSPSPQEGRGLESGTAPARIPAFNLFDPLKRFAWLHEDAASGGQRTHDAGLLPELPPVDDYRIAPARLSTWLGLRRTPENRAHDADPVGTIRLCLRLQAFKAALEDIPAQAMRLARWKARAKLGQKVRPRRVMPMRGGFPPGHRKRRIHEVDDILRECHTVALSLMNQRPDTS